MGTKTVKTQSGVWVCVKTTADQILELGSEDGVVGPVRKTKEDLSVGLEGDVATDHVVKEDAQRPDCETVCCVPSVFDPFRWSVYAGS